MPLKSHPSKTDLTAERVREILDYNPETGLLQHKPRPVRPGHERHDKIWNKRYASGRIRAASPNRYLHMRVDGSMYRAHRIAWLFHYGRWPTLDLDHANGDRSDNRISNLREAEFSQNTMNSKRRSDNASGLKGVDFHVRTGKWRARVGIGTKNFYLGLFATAEEAHAAYRAGAANLHGKFRRFE